MAAQICDARRVQIVQVQIHGRHTAPQIADTHSPIQMCFGSLRAAELWWQGGPTPAGLSSVALWLASYITIAENVTHGGQRTVLVSWPPAGLCGEGTVHSASTRGIGLEKDF